MTKFLSALNFCYVSYLFKKAAKKPAFKTFRKRIFINTTCCSRHDFYFYPITFYIVNCIFFSYFGNFYFRTNVNSCTFISDTHRSTSRQYQPLLDFRLDLLPLSELQPLPSLKKFHRLFLLSLVQGFLLLYR